MAIKESDDRTEHLAFRGVTTEQVDEAVADPNAVVITPDYASISGLDRQREC